MVLDAPPQYICKWGQTQLDQLGIMGFPPIQFREVQETEVIRHRP
jgi:hypothetical protein